MPSRARALLREWRLTAIGFVVWPAAVYIGGGGWRYVVVGLIVGGALLAWFDSMIQGELDEDE